MYDFLTSCILYTFFKATSQLRPVIAIYKFILHCFPELCAGKRFASLFLYKTGPDYKHIDHFAPIYIEHLYSALQMIYIQISWDKIKFVFQ